MGLTVNHVLTATTPDNTSYEIRPQEHWNATHAVTFAQNWTASGNTTQSTSGSGDGMVISGAGLASVGISNNSIIISVPAGAPSPVNFSAGTTSGNLGSVVFSNSNGVSFGLNGSTITASAAGGGGGSISAGGVDATLGRVIFSNSNGLSFGVNGQTVTGSHNGVTDRSDSYILLGNTFGDSTHNLSVLRASFTGPISGGFVGSSLQFSVNASHSRGVTGNTLGDTSLNDSRMFYSYTGRITGGFNGSSLQMSVDASHSRVVTGNTINNSTLNDTRIWHSYTGNISGGFNGSSLQVSVPVDASVTLNGNTTHSSTGTYAYRDLRMSGAGVASVGISSGTIIVSVPAGGGAGFSAGISGGNTSGDTGTVSNRIVFAGGNNVTVSGSTNAGGMSVTISGANAGGTQTGISGIVASDTTYTSGTVSFSNQNGVTIGSSVNGATQYIRLSVANQTNQQMTLFATGNTTQSSSGTSNASSLIFRGEGVASVGVTNGSVVVSVPAGGGGLTNINVSAGTTSQNLSNVVFSDSHGISFGLNGSTVTADMQPLSVFDKFQHMAIQYRNIGTLGGSWSFNNFELDRPLVMDRFGQHGFFSNASNSTGTYSLSVWFGIYTKNASTMSLWQSSSSEWQFTGSGVIGNANQQHGMRLFTIPMTTTIPAGQYYMGIGARFSTAGADASISFVIGADVANSTNSGNFGVASTVTWQWQPGRGIWTASSTAVPGSVAFSHLSGVFNVNKQVLFWNLRSDTV